MDGLSGFYHIQEGIGIAQPKAGVLTVNLDSYSWLSKISPLDISRHESAILDYPPALVIGLGKIGQIALSQIKLILCERHWGNFPEKVKLLAIQSGNDVVVHADNLSPYEKVSYNPQTPFVDYEMLARKSYFGWLRGATVDPVPRITVRAKFFLGLQSREQSQVYKALEAAIDSFNSVPEVFFVADLNEPESAILWDIAFLLRHKIAQERGLRMKTARFTAFLSVNSQTISSYDSNGVFPSLRELERFLFNGNLSFIYPSSELSGVTDKQPLVDLCFLVDTKSSGREVPDLSMGSDDEGVVRSISETLLILLKSDDGLNQAIQNATKETSEARDRYDMAFVSGLGIATLALPVQELSKAVEFRLLRTLLFGGKQLNGLFPVPWDGSTPAQIDLNDDAAKKYVNENFLGKLYSIPAFVSFLDMLIHGKVNSNERFNNLPANFDGMFANELGKWITQELNGNGDLSFARRSNRFASLQAYLSGLLRILNQSKFTLDGLIRSKKLLDQGVNNHLNVWIRMVEQSDAELKNWLELLVGKSVTSSTLFGRRLSGQARADVDTSLLKMIEQDWYAARHALSRRVTAMVRKAPMVDGVNLPPYSGLEEMFYVRHIQQLDSSTGILDRFAARLGWNCQVTKDATSLFFLIVPPEYSGESFGRISQDFLVGNLYDRTRMTEIYNRIRELASYYSRSVWDESLDSYLINGKSDIAFNEAFPGMAEFLQQAEYPLLPSNLVDSRISVESVSSHFLATSDPRLSTKIKDELSKFRPYSKPQDVDQNIPIKGSQSVSRLSLYRQISLGSTLIYQQAKLAHNYQSGAYIFVPEQYIALVEHELRNILDEPFTFHPQFSRLFEVGVFGDQDASLRYIPLANLFLKCWLYGLLKYDRLQKGWQIPRVGRFAEIFVHDESNDLIESLNVFALDLPFSSLHISHQFHANNISQYILALNDFIKDELSANRGNVKGRLRDIDKVISRRLSTSDYDQMKERLPDLDLVQFSELLRHADEMKRNLGAYLKYLMEEERFSGF